MGHYWLTVVRLDWRKIRKVSTKTELLRFERSLQQHSGHQHSIHCQALCCAWSTTESFQALVCSPRFEGTHLKWTRLVRTRGCAGEKLQWVGSTCCHCAQIWQSDALVQPYYRNCESCARCGSISKPEDIFASFTGGMHFTTLDLSRVQSLRHLWRVPRMCDIKHTQRPYLVHQIPLQDCLIPSSFPADHGHNTSGTVVWGIFANKNFHILNFGERNFRTSSICLKKKEINAKFKKRCWVRL